MTNKTIAGADRAVGIEWSVEGGELGIKPKLSDSLLIRGIGGSLTVDGRVFFLSDAEKTSVEDGRDKAGHRTCKASFIFADPDFEWVWDITEHADSITLIARLHNRGTREIAVSDWNVLHAKAQEAEIINLGEDRDNVRIFVNLGGFNKRVERFAGRECTCNCDNLCHIYDPCSGITFLSAFVTLDRMYTGCLVEHSDASEVTEYRAACTFGEYGIEAGESLESEKLHIGYYRDPYEALEMWADLINATYNPSFEGTLDVNWSGGAWIDAFTGQEPWAKILLENAEAINERLKGFDIRYLNAGSHKIMKDGLPGNWLTFEECEGYSGGYPALFKKLREMGFVFKFWFSPFWFYGEAKGVLEENRDNLLRDKNGDPITEKDAWEFDRKSDRLDTERLTKYFLDGTHPGTIEYVSGIFRACRELGARAYMLDFLSVKPEAKLYDDSLLPVEAGRKILESIRKTAGPDTHIQTAVASSPGFVGCLNSARVVSDHGEGRPMYPFHGWQNATYALHHRNFSNPRDFVRNAAFSWYTHRKIYVNDLNCLTIDKPVPLEQARISVTMFGLAGGSPVGLGDDIRNMDSERLRMLKMCLPRNESMPRPVDMFDRVHPDDYSRILKLSVETCWDTYMLGAVFNFDDKPCETDLSFIELGLDGNTDYRVFDFWDEEYTGTFRNSFPCTIPPDACRLYRISEARPYPWLLATDIHVQQGAVEVESLDWDEEKKILKGVTSRPEGEAGNLFFLIPRHLKLKNHDGANTMKELFDMQTVVRLPVK